VADSHSSQFSKLTADRIVAPQRVLIRGVNWLGDAVMSTPALMRLRERFPEAHMATLCAAKLKDLWIGHPAINEIIDFAPDEGVLSVSRKLRERSFDLVVVLPNSPRSALEVWLAGIPRRIGLARSWRNWFLTEAVPPRPGAVTMRKRTEAEVRSLVAQSSEAGFRFAQPGDEHQLFDLLHLVAALGADKRPLAPMIAVSDSEISALRQRFPVPEGKVIVGLNAGAEYGPAKRWPIENFIAVARAVQKDANAAILIFGGKGDMALAEKIESAIRSSDSLVHNLAGRTNLRELCAGLKLCHVVVTNDTGPMHVAAALGTPVVVPFGSTSPELTGPGSPGETRHVLLKSTALCSPCFLRECPIDFRCMKGIGVEAVMEGVLKAVRSRSCR
jgi:lipopolysaccharide heptosyltransferase II